jgi:hypothetical protein
MKCTTQLAVRNAKYPLRQRYWTGMHGIHHKRLRTRIYTDTLFSRVISINGYRCAQIFCNKDYVRVVPMTSKAHAGRALLEFIQCVGIPNKIIADGAAELSKENTEFMQHIRSHHIVLRHTEPYTPKQNFAERMIGELKRKWKHCMVTRSIPSRLWDYGFVYEAEIMSRTARGSEGRTGIERLTGDSIDISEWLDFEFYDLIWYWHGPSADKDPNLGRWLGVAHQIGSDLCYWIINDKAQVLARTTVQHVPFLDQQDIDIRRKVDRFKEKLRAQLDDLNYTDESQALECIQDTFTGNDEVEQQMALPQDDYTDEAFDVNIGSELLTTYLGDFHRARVTKQIYNKFGDPVGKRNDNPKLDTRMFEVVMDDGAIAEYTANMIAENLYAQVDEEGNRHLIFKDIIDHRCDNNAVLEKHIDKPTRTTKGWFLLVEWRDNTTSWVSLDELKASNPVQVAEYAYSNHLIDEPAFKWWAKKVLRQRNHIVSKIKSRYWRTTHKFGIRLPHSVEEATVSLIRMHGGKLSKRR